MADVTKYLDKYALFYTSGSGTALVTIQCFNAGTLVGSLVFWNDGGNLPPNSYVNNVITINYAMSRFADVHRILLHEKPLSLYISTSTQNGWLATSQEAIGEEEV